MALIVLKSEGEHTNIQSTNNRSYMFVFTCSRCCLNSQGEQEEAMVVFHPSKWVWPLYGPTPFSVTTGAVFCKASQEMG